VDQHDLLVHLHVHSLTASSGLVGSGLRAVSIGPVAAAPQQPRLTSNCGILCVVSHPLERPAA